MTSLRVALPVGLLLLFGLTQLGSLGMPHLQNITLKLAGTPLQAIPLPWRAASTRETSREKPDKFVIRGELQYSGWMQTAIRIVPDDCIESIRINQRLIPISSAGIPGACDVAGGFSFDFEGFLLPGKNTVEFNGVDFGNRKGLVFEGSWKSPLFALSLLGFFLIATGLMFLVLKRTRIEPVLIPLFLVAMGVQLFYLSRTPPLTRAMDIIGHLDHITLVKQTGWIPKSNECWECFQPPLYYYMAAIESRVLDPLVSYHAVEKGLQFLSFILFQGFQLIACLVLQLSLGAKKHWLGLAGALLLFWPSGILHSAQIGNDVPSYLCQVLSFFFLLKWWDDPNPKHFERAALAVSLGFFVKSSAVVSLGMLAAVFLGRLQTLPSLAQRISLAKSVSRGWIRVGVALVAFFSLLLFVKGVYLTKTSLLPAGLIVQNQPLNYLWFDLHSFFHEAFLNNYEDVGGRQFFWNYLLKSSLFGEYSYSDAWHQGLGTVLAAGLLGLTGLAGLGALVPGALRMKNWEWHALQIGACVAALMIYRIIQPYSVTGDFRYLFPALVSLICFSIHGLRILAERAYSLLYGAGVMLILVFCLTSAAFYVTV